MSAADRTAYTPSEEHDDKCKCAKCYEAFLAHVRGVTDTPSEERATCPTCGERKADGTHLPGFGCAQPASGEGDVQTRLRALRERCARLPSVDIPVSSVRDAVVEAIAEVEKLTKEIERLKSEKPKR